MRIVRYCCIATLVQSLISFIRISMAAMIIMGLVLTLTNCSASSKHVGKSRSVTERYEHRFGKNDLITSPIRVEAPKRYASNQEIWRVIARTDAISKSNDAIRLFYTRRVIPWNHRASGENQGNTDYWNREHIWPQSKGLKGNQSRKDLYNIVPADSSVNSSRGNKYFDYALCPHKECVDCRADSQRWEPPDDVKGDVARIVFYMDAVYNELSKADMLDLRLVDVMQEGRKSDFGKLDTLLAWHCADPVSQYERNRNNIISKIQGNRNRFVDEPELVSQRYGLQCEAISTHRFQPKSYVAPCAQ